MHPAGDGGRSERAPEAHDDEAGRRCTATTLAGERCQNWALAHTEQPLCRVHAYPGAHGQLRYSYYRRTPYYHLLVESTLARLAAEGEPLVAEIVVARLQIAGLLACLGKPDLTAGQRLSTYRILLRALRVVARLMRM